MDEPRNDYDDHVLASLVDHPGFRVLVRRATTRRRALLRTMNTQTLAGNFQSEAHQALVKGGVDELRRLLRIPLDAQRRLAREANSERT